MFVVNSIFIPWLVAWRVRQRNRTPYFAKTFVFFLILFEEIGKSWKTFFTGHGWIFFPSSSSVPGTLNLVAGNEAILGVKLFSYKMGLNFNILVKFEKKKHGSKESTIKLRNILPVNVNYQNSHVLAKQADQSQFCSFVNTHCWLHFSHIYYFHCSILRHPLS